MASSGASVAVVFLALLLVAAPLCHSAVQNDQCGAGNDNTDNNHKFISTPLCQRSYSTTCGTISGIILKTSSGSLGTAQNGNTYNSATKCCTTCQADNTCDAFNFVSNKCYYITSTDCSGSNGGLNGFQNVTSAGDTSGTGMSAKSRCSGTGANAGLDPHFELVGLPDLEEGGEFAFDFHGEDNMTYCMVSDTRLEMNVRMFGLPEGTKILQHRKDEDQFFTGTWMSGFGVSYLNQQGQQQDVTIELDQALDREGKYPFIVMFGKDTVLDLESGPWTSPDGLATIDLVSGGVNRLSISISDLLEMETVTDSEKELIADPPVHFLNFEIKHIATSAVVHGFLGQMFAPGAVVERLAMGTLEGLRHREYVEGADEEYLTSGLIATDCSYNRFGELPNDLMVSDGSIKGTASHHLSDVEHTRRLLSSGLTSPSAHCRKLEGPNRFACK